MTKRERAIRAMADKLDLRDATFGLGAALDAAMAIMAEPDELPEGKQRVRACAARREDGGWFILGNSRWSDRAILAEVAEMMEPARYGVAWIEADVTPWQPPAEETVQGREVEG